MKVVLFCGGLGMRIRPLSPHGQGGAASAHEDLPKPMVHIGTQRPLIWHVMKYYAHFGHKDFILCLGYRSEVIKDYFLHYDECVTNDFVLSDGGAKVELVQNDIQDWRIRFVDTGLFSNVGERLAAVRAYLEDDEEFIVNYSDGLTDLPHDEYHQKFRESGKTAAFVCVRPPHTSHVVYADDDGRVTSIAPFHSANVRINGGYFIFRRELFDYMRPGEELVQEPFQRLIKQDKLFAYKYDGFWTCIDTFKEKQELDERYARGDTPWQVWKS